MRNWNKFLLALTGLMMIDFLACLVGLFVDGRIITGSPAWLKPAKFAISTAIYGGTFAWILRKIEIWPKFVNALGNTTAVMLFVEIAIIDLQAWRGTTSHFNFTSNLDSSLFGIMGIGIGTLWLASAGVCLALFRQNFRDASLGWALRLGMLITVIGSISGGLMVSPRPGHQSGIIGSHTIGAPDGGKGMAITGWSTAHGDLRIPHFVGLHGMQAIPFIYWLLARRRRPRTSTVFIAAAGYLALFVILVWQALSGQPLFHPDMAATTAWALLIAGTLTALLSQTGLGQTSLAQTKPLSDQRRFGAGL